MSASSTDADFDARVSDTLAAVGRHWGLLFVFGIVSALIGVITLVWPGKTLVVFAVFFGAWLLISGIFQLIEAFSRGLDGGARALYAISGLCGILLGLMCFRGVLQSLQILSLLVGLAWIIRGILTFMTALTVRGVPGRGWAILGGILLFIGGVVIIEWPAITLVALTVVAGAWLLVFGIIQIFGAFQARKFAPA